MKLLLHCAKKLLLYCTKGKPYLYKNTTVVGENIFTFAPFIPNENDIINGKIVAECDFEVEEIEPLFFYTIEDVFYTTKTLRYCDLVSKSCLSEQQLDDYLNKNNGYAIHIKNLHIFDEPKELNYYDQLDKEALKEGEYETNPITKAPKNMMYCEDGLETAVIISMHSEELCKILNKEKTIVPRKKILNGMKK